ncbi:hypothetical protein, partial [Nostoc sp.]|uniref:hypothetical protein n=1 Tax=Nostoc sp. TaxID=1180 RepID=UPI002FF7C021
LRVSISINPASSETLARVQCVKKGNPRVSIANWIVDAQEYLNSKPHKMSNGFYIVGLVFGSDRL